MLAAIRRLVLLVLGCSALVVYQDPTHGAGDLVFTPLIFSIAWLVGFALRERADQAEVAEERARQAERDREAAARVAVAEERARMAREPAGLCNDPAVECDGTAPPPPVRVSRSSHTERCMPDHGVGQGQQRTRGRRAQDLRP